MLAQTDYLVCLLPLTSSTQGIINKQLLEQLPEHAVVINVARGGHIVEADLLDALNNTRIRAATLDVFASEPLPSEHPYWLHPGITLTPHCAALSDLDSVIEQIAENILRLKAKQPLINCIDKCLAHATNANTVPTIPIYHLTGKSSHIPIRSGSSRMEVQQKICLKLCPYLLSSLIANVRSNNWPFHHQY